MLFRSSSPIRSRSLRPTSRSAGLASLRSTERPGRRCATPHAIAPKRGWITARTRCGSGRRRTDRAARFVLRAIGLDFLGPSLLLAKNPDFGGLICLDFLVRIVTFQWVKRIKRTIFFFMPPGVRRARAGVRNHSERCIVHEPSVIHFLVFGKALSFGRAPL